MNAPPREVRPDGAARWGAFAYPHYRRFWLASLARVFGIQFRFIAVGWFVVASDGLDLPARWLGIAALASSLPTILLSIPAGVLADRYEHRWLLAGTLAANCLLSLALALGIAAGVVDVWILIAWALVTGTLTAMGIPAQSAIIPRLIEMRAMASAVALTSSIWNTMRIVGPASAGLMIAAIGIAPAFLVTAAGYALSALLIASLRLAPIARVEEPRPGQMLEGLRYIAGHQIFLATIGLSFFTSIFGGAYQTLMPIFADDILGVGSRGFGFMEAAIGIGSVLGTLAMIWVGSKRQAGSIMLLCAGLFGVFIAGFAASRAIELSMALLFCAGFVSSMYLNIGMTTLQLHVPDELRGRVMGVWSMTWFLVAVGGLPASLLSEWIGAPWTVALGALSVSAFAAVVYLYSSELRRLPPAPLDAAAHPS